MRGGIIVCLLACICVSGAVQAESIKIFISSGTGFLVTHHGHIITNNHVVSYCQRIVVNGAVSGEARLIERDEKHDLAILKADVPAGDIAVLRPESQPAQAGERVVIVGYPGQAARLGSTVTRQAQVTSPKGPQGEDEWVQVSDVIRQGNSGGPLLDASGHVLGVVSAKATIYTYQKDNPQNGTLRNSGIAINLPVLREFLDDAGVYYREEESRSDLSADRISDMAQRFIVNVQCQYRTELRR